MKFNFRLYLLILLVISFSVCKFEDGPLINLRTTKGRLIKSSPWTFVKLEVNGLDKTYEYSIDSAAIIEIRFNKVHPSRVGTGEHSFGVDGNYFYGMGEFEITSRNKMKFGYSAYGATNVMSYAYYGPIFIGNQEWEISRLSLNELQMKLNYQGDNYKIYFKRKE
jgi:hypothetical protein